MRVKIIERLGEAPVYTAEREILASLTGYTLTRGVLCAMRRPEPLVCDDILKGAFRVAVLENIVDSTNMGAIYHSDRGCQYTAKKTKQLVEGNGFCKSMSRPGTPSDNQPIESFWKPLECEMADISHLTFEEASRTIVSYIELYYNSERLHSGIGYCIPNHFFTLLSVH